MEWEIVIGLEIHVQLVILPEDAEFKKGNYDLRISIATVEVEKSTFTPLPGVNRILTILNGELQLIHEGHHSTTLKQYQQDSFLGDWQTKSIGKVRDFNVMTRNYLAEVTIHHLSTDETIHLLSNDFFFLAEGKATINKQKIEANDSLLCEDTTVVSIIEQSVIIRVRIKK